MSQSTCTHPGCEKATKCRGWCSAHYERWRKHGSTDVVLAHVPPPRPKPQTPTCVVDGCPVVPTARNHCGPHYRKLMKYGDPLASRKRVRRRCEVDECESAVHGHGFCYKHYMRMATTGTTDPIIRRLDACEVEGCSAPMVRGRATLCDAHYSERWRYGSIGATHPCVDCGSPIKRMRRRCKDCAYASRLLASKNQGHERRVLMRGGTADKVNALDVYERDAWICGLCSLPVDRDTRWPHPMSASLDHILPITRGGNHTLDNVQLAHLRCNTSKGNRLVLARA